MLSMLARLTRRLAPACAVRTNPDGFAAHDTVVPWDDVSRVLAETQPGFDAFVRMADRRLVFPLAWWEALPRTRRVVLFEAALREVHLDHHPPRRTAHG